WRAASPASQRRSSTSSPPPRRRPTRWPARPTSARRCTRCPWTAGCCGRSSDSQESQSPHLSSFPPPRPLLPLDALLGHRPSPPPPPRRLPLRAPRDAAPPAAVPLAPPVGPPLPVRLDASGGAEAENDGPLAVPDAVHGREELDPQAGSSGRGGRAAGIVGEW